MKVLLLGDSVQRYIHLVITSHSYMQPTSPVTSDGSKVTFEPLALKLKKMNAIQLKKANYISFCSRRYSIASINSDELQN